MKHRTGLFHLAGRHSIVAAFSCEYRHAFVVFTAFLCLASGPAFAQRAVDTLPGPKAPPSQTVVSPAQPSTTPVCTKSYCKNMRTCAEAYHHFSACGMQELDRDNDGIPCEDACGKTIAQMEARIKAEPYTSGSNTALGLMTAPQRVKFSWTASERASRC